MEFVWNDGGRAACGFVGTTGDCVTRAIAIATGTVYRDIYAALGEAAEKSPRSGLPVEIAAAHLAELGWRKEDGQGKNFSQQNLPVGVVIAHLSSGSRASHHLCTIVDHVVHDTWNPADDDAYVINDFWTFATCRGQATSPEVSPHRPISRAQELTQQEFDKIIRRLRALEKTASNQASTEGEKRNALRMIHNLMLSNNLTRDDVVGRDNVDNLQFTRMACPVNGRRACTWEKQLAIYVIEEIVPTVQFYRSAKGHRTFFWFYGPLADVQNAVTLYRELLLTIATAAQLLYRSYIRGSGASYAEGYVAGLPRPSSDTPASGLTQPQPNDAQSALVQTRMLAIHNAAEEWLAAECGVRLVTTRRRGRYDHDPLAERRGKSHGASHDVKLPDAPKRIAQL